MGRNDLLRAMKSQITGDLGLSTGIYFFYIANCDRDEKSDESGRYESNEPNPYSEKSENFTPETPASYYARQTSKHDEKPRKTRLGMLLIPNATRWCDNDCNGDVRVNFDLLTKWENHKHFLSPISAVILHVM